jgi:hypothetical protein
MDGEFRQEGGVIEIETACAAAFREFPKTIVMIERRTLIRECLARCLPYAAFISPFKSC